MLIWGLSSQLVRLGGRRGLGRTGLPYKLCVFTKRGIKALSCGNQLMPRWTSPLGVDSTCSQVLFQHFSSKPHFWRAVQVRRRLWTSFKGEHQKTLFYHHVPKIHLKSGVKGSRLICASAGWSSRASVLSSAVFLLLCSHALFPLFFCQISTLKRQGRTLFSSVPETAEKEAHSQFVQEVRLTHTWMWACFDLPFIPRTGAKSLSLLLTEAAAVI